MLDARHAPAAIKLVAGAGYGGYQPLARLDENWRVHWVRGPHTAALLGLPAVTRGRRSGHAAANAGWRAAQNAAAIGFMPHFESLARGAWPEAAALAGIALIDPRGDPAEIIPASGACRLLLTEAMHGAIVADALRVPWVALRPLSACIGPSGRLGGRTGHPPRVPAPGSFVAFGMAAGFAPGDLPRAAELCFAWRTPVSITPVPGFRRRTACALPRALRRSFPRCRARPLPETHAGVVRALRRDPLNGPPSALRPRRNSAYDPVCRATVAAQGGLPPPVSPSRSLRPV